MTQKEFDTIVKDRGLDAARIVPQDIEDSIAEIVYWLVPNTTCTVCAVTMRNGFVLIGKSAAASEANFDTEIGERLALDDAKQQMWPLLGYALRNQLSGNVI